MFACTRKERQISRAGTPYLTVELRDSTRLDPRARLPRRRRARRALRARRARARARARRALPRAAADRRCESIARADGRGGRPGRFLPAAYRDLDELEGFLEHLAREVYDPGCKALLARPARRRRSCAPSCAARPARLPRGRRRRRRRLARAAHHAYLGGLLEHTVAVATLALELCALHPRLDRDLLLSAAIVHDLGKTREFTYGAEIERSDEGRLLGHVELGLRLIAEHAPAGARRASAAWRSSTA